MDWLLLVGRILFALLFVMNGLLFHLRNREMAIGYSKMMGAPAPEITVLLTGIQILVAGLMIVLGIWVDLAALLIIAFLIPTNYWMHSYWKMEGEQKQFNQVQFWKNTALIGASLILFFLYQQFGEEIGLNIEPALFD